MILATPQVPLHSERTLRRNIVLCATLMRFALQIQYAPVLRVSVGRRPRASASLAIACIRQPAKHQTFADAVRMVRCPADPGAMELVVLASSSYQAFHQLVKAPLHNLTHEFRSLNILILVP